MSSQENQNMPFVDGEVVKLQDSRSKTYIGRQWQGFGMIAVLKNETDADPYTVRILDPTINQIVLEYNGFIYSAIGWVAIGGPPIINEYKLTITSVGENEILIQDIRGWYFQGIRPGAQLKLATKKEDASKFVIHPIPH